MYKKILSVAVLLAVVLSTTSCEKQVKAVKPSNYIISDADVKRMGDYHNESLEKAFINFDWEAENHKEELLLQFKENEIAFDSDKRRDMNVSKKDNLEKTLFRWEKKMSEKAFTYVEDALELCDNIDHYSVFSEDLELLKNQVMSSYESKEISSVEVNSLLVTIGILDSSAYFWAPVDKGGSGVGYKILVTVNSLDENQRRRFKWKTAMTSDGVSAGFGMLGVAVYGVLATNPIGWGILVAVAVESAFNSGFFGCF